MYDKGCSVGENYACESIAELYNYAFVFLVISQSFRTSVFSAFIFIFYIK
jgi:hypothetical protein